MNKYKNIKSIIFDLNGTIIPKLSTSENHRKFLENFILSLKPKSKNLPKLNMSTKSILETNKIPYGKYLDYRDRNYNYKKEYSKSPLLQNLFRKLSKKYRLIVLTNTTKYFAKRSTTLLGINNYFDFIISRELTLNKKVIKKPNIKVYDLILYLAECEPNEILVLGNKYEKDIKPFEERGASGILIENETYLEKELLKILTT